MSEKDAAYFEESNLHVNCRKATYFISTSYERRLSFREKILLFIHLLFCKYCRRFKRQWVRLSSFFQSEANENFSAVQLSEADKVKLKEMIRKESGE